MGKHDIGYFEVELMNKLEKTVILLEKIYEENKKMSQAVDNLTQMVADLTEAVTAETTVVTSAVTLINGFATTLTDIKAQLDAAIAALQANQVDTTAIEAIAANVLAEHDAVEASTAELAAAVAANTPAA
jgi:hypothetical protein